jgi:hypothetical protein
MGTPYFKAGIILGQRVFTTTGTSFVTAPLRFNDYLDENGDWLERTGSTPFTGAYTYRMPTSDAICFVSKSSPTDDDPSIMTEYPSGAIETTHMRYPRETITIIYKQVVTAEALWMRMFWRMNFWRKDITYVDEWDNEIIGKIMSFTPDKDINRSASTPYEIAITFMDYHTSELYTQRSGGQITY